MNNRWTNNYEMVYIATFLTRTVSAALQKISRTISKVAKTGAGETTKEITPYEGRGYRLFDIPNRNDELSYFSMEYVAFWKGLTGRLIVMNLKRMNKNHLKNKSGMKLKTCN
jgi:hypothetical protein